MVFSSIDFLFIFLPAFLAAYAALPAKNAAIVLFSLAFYFVGEGWYVVIVLASVGMNYGFGLAISSRDGVARKQFLIAAITANLLGLIFFKYSGFIASLFGVAISMHLLLGISFFTFHAISYLIDVYRRDAPVEHSLPNLALYILMFPQLIAGPILRYAKIAPQLVERSVTGLHVYYGLLYFFVGLGAKVLIADAMAGIADPLFDRWQQLSMIEAWIAALSYTFQIYFDFSGYSAMAIGLGLICGFDFPQNFNFPYVSQSITEFWRRWHMTLSSWFRDYLYIPLGGNRHGEAKTYRNLVTVFVLCGLWHGAAWTFLIWGLYHGLLLIVERMVLSRVLQRAPSVIRHVYAMLAVTIGWVLFRAQSADQAAGVLTKMFVPDVSAPPLAQIVNNVEVVTFIAAGLFSTPVVYYALRSWAAVPEQRPWPTELRLPHYVAGLTLTTLVFAASLLKIYTGSYSPFIYFRF
jgi:alginate O-acetyltransferase complex protein AlgI